MEEKEYIRSIISELFKSTYNRAAAKAVENGDEELAIKFLTHSNEMGIEDDASINSIYFNVVIDKPYKEDVDGNLVYRTFSNNINENELVWHRDKEDRIIFPLHETDWKFQFDDELPIEITPDNPIFIESERFHRLIKGSDELELEIYKTNLEDEENIQTIISETLQLFLEKRGKSSRTKKGRKVPGKYLTAKSAEKRSQMKKEIDKFADKHHSDPEAYTKQWQADKGQKTKESEATKAYKKMFGEDLDFSNQYNDLMEESSSKNNKGLKNKSKASGIPYYILKQVYNRGMAAWRTGHRPGVAQNQWAMGRVNSFITGSGGSRKADSDLWKKAKASKDKKRKSNKK